MRNFKELKNLTDLKLDDQKLSTLKGGSTIIDLLDWSKKGG